MAKEVNIREVADEVFNNVFGGNLIFFEGAFYTYSHGYWHQHKSLRTIKKLILKKCPKLDLATINRIVETLMIENEVESMQPPSGIKNQLLAFRNGTLDLVTIELIDHDPEHMLRHGFNFDWNPDFTCDLWEQSLYEIFKDDDDADKRIDFLREWFGYCLTEDISQHKFLWLYGKGSNGKSLLLNILTAMVGPEHVSNAKLERLANPFARAQLQGKLVNISAEMSANSTVADGYLKELVSGDRIEAEHKHQPAFSFAPVVKLVGATNSLPRLLDVSHGFFRRAIILELTRQFSEEERDTELESKLLAELPGITLWAVIGLLNLRDRGWFDVPPSANRAAEAYRRESDHVLTFLADECVTVETGGVRPAELYDAYKVYAKNNSFAVLNAITFGKRLANAGVATRKSNGLSYWLVRLANVKSMPIEEFKY